MNISIDPNIIDAPVDSGEHITAMPRPFILRFGIGCGVLALVVLVLFCLLLAWGGWRGKQEAFVDAPATAFTKDVTAEEAPIASLHNPATSDDPSIGPENAVLTIVEFSDFECPFCKQAFPIVRELMATYDDRVRYIYRDYPVDALHPNARRAAEAGACAHEQGKFWAFHDRLFANQNALARDDLSVHARAAGLDGDAFERCMETNRFTSEVENDFQDGVALGVRGTPTWFLNGHKVEGVIPQQMFIEIIEAVLTAAQ
jgi:protein-disulfide isomerase